MSLDVVKVLIVDDDHNFLKVMRETFKLKGCHVETASNQGEALDTLLNQVVDIVFIDCVLLSEQGMDLAQKIKEHLGASIDIVMMSGIVSQDIISNCADTNISSFLQKPISNQQVEKCISKVKERLMFGSENQFLLKIFDKKISTSYKLKYFLSLEKTQNIDFLLILTTFLDSKEPGHVTFSTNTKDEHKISFNKGFIVNYNSYNSERLLKYFLDKNLLTEEIAKKFENTDCNVLINKLVEACHVSPFQVIDAKLEMLEVALKQIMLSQTISFKIKLFTSEAEEFCLKFSQSDMADFIFQNKNDRFDDSLASYFDKKVLDLSFQFEKNSNDIKYDPEVNPLIAQLKTGLKLSSLSTEDKSLYKKLFYILNKGKVYFSNFSDKFKYAHFYERYKNLRKFFQTEDSYHIFQLLSNKEKAVLTNDSKLIHSSYLHFMKFNHPDKLSENLPKELLNLIIETLEKLRYHHDVILNPKVKQKAQEIEKNKKIKEDMIIVRKKQACKSFLEREDCERAFSVLREIPDELIEKDIMWQLFYLWIAFSDSNLDYDESKKKKYLQIVAQNNEIRRNYIYHYVLGLYYESKQNYPKAFSCYQNTKTLEPSFKTIYSAIKRVAFKKTEKKKGLLFSKAMSYLSKDKNKKAS